MARLARAPAGRLTPESQAHVIARVSRELALERPEVSALDGGGASGAWRLRDGTRDLVVRIRGTAAARLGASVKAEAAMQSLAAQAGLAPRVVLADPAGGFLVSEFAEGRMPGRAAMGDPVLLARVGAWCAQLHALAAPAGLPVIDFGARAAGYLAQAARGVDAPTLARLDQALARRRAAVGIAERIAPCHHDLHRRNLLDDGVRLAAIDWEYAGPGDPAADLAACAGYHALDERAVDALVAGYGGDAQLRARVESLAWIFACLWYGWNAAAARLGIAVDEAEQSRLAARLLG
jgi:aminoglycoside phosphotransferase (APT) family kinase protein